MFKACIKKVDKSDDELKKEKKSEKKRKRKDLSYLDKMKILKMTLKLDVKVKRSEILAKFGIVNSLVICL